MKKFLFAISVICYLVVSSGIVINSHYCMKRLVSVHAFEKVPDECGRCGMEIHGNNGCCKNEIRMVKMADDQQSHNFLAYEINAPESVAVQPSAFMVAPFVSLFERAGFHNHSPPLLSAQDTYLLNRVFRI